MSNQSPVGLPNRISQEKTEMWVFWDNFLRLKR